MHRNRSDVVAVGLEGMHLLLRVVVKHSDVVVILSTKGSVLSGLSRCINKIDVVAVGIPSKQYHPR